MLCKDLFCENENIWYVERCTNSIIRLGGDGQKTIIGNIPYSGTHPYCLKVKEKLICFPETGNIVTIYDITNDQFRKIEIDGIKNVNTINYWVRDCILWCVSRGGNCIIKIDIETESLVQIYTLFEEKGKFIGLSADMVDNKIYIPSPECTQILIFDIKSEKTVSVDIITAERGYNTISIVDDYIYLTGCCLNLYRYNMKDMSITTIELDEMKFRKYGDDVLFLKSVVSYGKIFFIPYTEPEHANAIVVHDICMESTEYFDILRDIYKECSAFGNRFVNIVRYYDVNQFDVYMDNLPLHRVDLLNHTVTILEEKYKDVRISKHYYEKPYILTESNSCTLNGYIDGVILYK